MPDGGGADAVTAVLGPHGQIDEVQVVAAVVDDEPSDRRAGRFGQDEVPRPRMIALVLSALRAVLQVDQLLTQPVRQQLQVLARVYGRSSRRNGSSDAFAGRTPSAAAAATEPLIAPVLG